MSILTKINTATQLWQNMGSRYMLFRSWFEISKRSGLLKSQFPLNPKEESFITLDEWKETAADFFFESREALNFPKKKSERLKEKIERFRKGDFQFFNASWKNIGTDYDWITNPDSLFKYDVNKHWVDINDFSSKAGDIKFVWEKSRFSFLLTIIRYDYHFEEDCSEWVFSEIDSWIDANPINQGPNYKCSQEISLRMLNWLFALYYYKNSNALTDKRFHKIMNVCYWQLHHVRNNIHFSRIAVRNNHAITETMMLYLGEIFFPFFPNVKKWSQEGLKWLEEEVAYQVYKDGTFLQFSHNYHRVLVQLLTWSLYLSELNGKTLSKIFIHRSQRTLEYLYQCQLKENGHLPNYGANDGALFFPLNDCEYRDYRPQLNALAFFFNRKDLYLDEGDWSEDRYWYTANSKLSSSSSFKFDFKHQESKAFSDGGYYITRDDKTLTFLRCGNHKDRPSHADNLHLDLWYKGVNIIRDAGTYKYNTDPETLDFFVGTKGHNTVMLGTHNQMKKGSRFIWYNWTQVKNVQMNDEIDTINIEGEIAAFGHVDAGITHKRTVKKSKSKVEWAVIDELNHSANLPMKQVWNIHPSFLNLFSIVAKDANNNIIEPEKAEHMYSGEYGVKEKSVALIYSTNEKSIQTTIQLL